MAERAACTPSASGAEERRRRAVPRGVRLGDGDHLLGGLDVRGVAQAEERVEDDLAAWEIQGSYGGDDVGR